MDDRSFQRALKNQQRYVKSLEGDRDGGLLWAIFGVLACFALTLWALGKLFGLL